VRQRATGGPYPFIKWAGGKGQLLTQLLHLSPPTFSMYHEPFLGGGALFFALKGQRPFFAARLNDLNAELINAYQVVKTRLPDLLPTLATLQTAFVQVSSQSEYYYRIRAQQTNDCVDNTARFIFLNKTGYNGLYRVNRKGQFNVPFGRHKNPNIYDAKNLQHASIALQSAVLSSVPFECALAYVTPGDFVYLDPPYQPVSPTANFTGYTALRFAESDQERLATEFHRLAELGAFVMLSNSDHELIEKLYEGRGYSITTVKANRQINSNAQRRGAIDELIVRNY
jgi:DNA adenine methylase